MGAGHWIMIFFFVSGNQIHKISDQKELQIKMLLTFNAVELCVVTINEKPWTRAKEVYTALKYNKKMQTLSKIIVVKKATPRSIK